MFSLDSARSALPLFPLVTPEQTADALLKRAEAALEIRRFEHALRDAQRACAHAPNNLKAHALMARALLGLNQPREALDAVTAGLRVAPDSEWLHRLRATAHLECNEPERAHDAIEQALKLAPNEPWVHLLHARVLRARAMQAESIRAARHAAELAPDEAVLHSYLGELLLAVNVPEAESVLREALRLDPRNATALNNLGVALMRQNRKWEAVHVFHAAVKADPTLDVAKRNTHAILRSPESYPLRVMVVVLVLLRVLHLVQSDRAMWPLLLAYVLVIALGFGFPAARHALRMRALRKRDPALYALFIAIDQDVRAGRLS